MAKEQPIVQRITTSKSFNYQKNDCSLNFSLNIDNSSQPRDFLIILKLAIKDVEEIIAGTKN